ncbi:hypothetical protein JCGZ_22748 [Jatropha curcas]|uniref:Agglutinin domain-containing protein n=1 Tax=Jatropha curcas TaxID=180498 RepID=A0A067L407_JATCU|nr:uncharacterized protein LOC105628969 [Jatropha curcas]KDP43196.1 hypothetical protein JCGZ_22748 [Jatropha curcas]
MAPVIPRLCVFKSNYGEKYLRYVQEENQRRYIRCDGEDILDPYAKFKVERAKSYKDLVHIRCSYSNKFWRRSSEDGDYIVAAADAAEEDQSKWSCTLFKPFAKDDITFRFQHLQSGNNVWFNRSDNDYRSCLIVRYSTEESDGGDLFTITDWESLVMLPKHVAFKGDNGKYLYYRGGGDEHLEFGASDIGDNRVGEQIITNPDGSISVKHDSNGKFWRATPNWIYPDTTDASNSDPEVSFWPVQLQGNAIALRNKSNGRFLRRTNYGGTVDCLAAASWATTIDKESHLVVEELVKVRQIYDVEYRLDDARIYDESILTLARSCVSNMTQQNETIEVTMSYKEAWKYEWSTSTSTASSISMKVSLGVPKIMDASIQVSHTIEKEYQWGETVDGSLTLKKTVPVTVPPMTKTTVSLLATIGSCNVPFSYTQQDTLTNGELDVSVKHDGVYSGVNCFKFRTETSEEKLLA